jgi:hypothetical protein
VERQSRDEKKHIVTKDVVGLLLGDLVSTGEVGGSKVHQEELESTNINDDDDDDEDDDDEEEEEEEESRRPTL